jgi:ribosome-associated protein
VRQIYVTDDLLIPYDEIEITTSRSSGPGGQHVNRTESRVQVRFDVAHSPSLTEDQRRKILTKLGSRIDTTGALRLASQKHKSQIQNREAALGRLAEVLRDGLYRDPPRRATKPTRSQKERRLRGKHQRSEVKRARRVAETE